MEEEHINARLLDVYINLKPDSQVRSFDPGYLSIAQLGFCFQLKDYLILIL